MRAIQITLRLILALAFVVGTDCGSDGVLSQERSPKPEKASKSTLAVQRETYDRVLDLVFPRSDPEPSKTVFMFVLRFHPNSDPESQIVIRRGVESVELVEYTPLEGNIYSRLNHLLAQGMKEDIVELAKEIKITKKRVTVSPEQLRGWQASFFDSLPKTNKVLAAIGREFESKGSETIFLHGGFYSLWYEQRMNRLSYHLYDVDRNQVDTDSEFSLVKWMDRVREETSRLK